MKKITCALLLLTLSINTSAATNEQILIDAAKATIENARANNSSIVLTAHHDIKIIGPSTAASVFNMTTVNIQSSLSNMRAQAELYYSNSNSYGITTQSCTAGMFADTTTGLGKLISATKKYSTVVTCASTKNTFIVSAKLNAASYHCVDSTGNSLVVGAAPKKGVMECSKVAKVADVTNTYTTDGTFNLMPKSGPTYEVDYTSSVSGAGGLFSAKTIAKGNTTYKLVNDSMLKYLKDGEVLLNQTTINKVRNNYVAIPDTLNYLNAYEGINTKKIDFTLDAIYKSDFTARSISLGTDGSQTFEVSIPYDIAMGASMIFNSRLYGNMYAGADAAANAVNGNQKILFTVLVKNGLIQSIRSKTPSVVGTKATDTFKFSIIPNTNSISLLTPLNVITCADMFVGYADLCNVVTSEKANAEVRSKGQDAAVQATLSNMRAQAELFYANNNGYGAVTQSCSAGIFTDKTSGGLSTLISDLTPNVSGVVCNSTGKSWMVSAKSSTSGNYYCSDSNGSMLTQTSLRLPTDTKCQ
ncbi:MAG: hypothetical protein V4576_00565 [Patescibacteria group bacterium]